MASQQPPSTALSPTTATTSTNPAVLHNIALFATIACPIIILLPPRKLDAYTMVLLSGTFLGGNQLAWEYTGRSFADRIKARSGRMRFTRHDRSLRRIHDEALRERLPSFKEGDQSGKQQSNGSGILAELAAAQEAEEKSVVEQLSVNSKPPSWKVDRDKREKEALDEGRGYGDLIMEQIWEVWNWGKKEVETTKEEDERVVAEGNGKR